MSQTPSSADVTKLSPVGDSGQVALTPRTNPNSPHPLAVNKPRTLSSKEEDEEIIKEVVRNQKDIIEPRHEKTNIMVSDLV